MIHLFKNKKRIITVLALSAFIFSLAIPFSSVKAQFVVSDPAGLAQSITKYFSDLGDQVSTQTKSYADDLIDNLVATIYKQGVGTILNVLAAETARSIATGDFGSPLFTDTKGFFNTLADGVVGDVINDIVNGAIGIDLCNINPEFTLGTALALPLFDEYKYNPRCSLTQIADQIEAIDLKNIVKFNLEITATDSWTGFFEQFKRDPVSAPTGLALAVQGLDEIYGKSDSDLNGMLANDQEEIEFLTEGLKSSETARVGTNRIDETGNSSFETSEDIKSRLDEYRCKIGYDLQRFNLAIFDLRDFSGVYEKTLKNKACKDIDTYQWSDNDSPDNTLSTALRTSIKEYFDEALNSETGWVNVSGTDARSLNTIISSIASGMDRYASQKKTPIEKGVARVEYLYNTCRVALDKALNVRLKTNYVTGPTQISNLAPGDQTKLSTLPVERSFSETDPRPENIKFTIVPKVGRLESPIIIIDALSTPRCDAYEAGNVYVPTRKDNGTFERTIPFTDIFRKDLNDTDFEAVVCYAIGAAVGSDNTNEAFYSNVFSYNFPLNSESVTGANQPPALIDNTFTADVPTADGNGFTPSTIEFTQVSALSEQDYITCQLAYNHGTLLRAYWQDDTGVIGGQFGFRKGPNKFPDGDSLSPRDRGQLVPEKLSAVNSATSQREVYNEVPLGIFAIFHPDILESYETIYIPAKKEDINIPKNNEELFAGFVRMTVMADAVQTGLGDSWRKSIFSGISNGHSMFKGTSEIVLKKLSDIEKTFTKLADQVDKVQNKDYLTVAERKKELDKASRLEAPSNASAQITKAVLNEKIKKREEELANKQIEGTLSNAPRSGVSDLALAIPEVQNERLAALISGDSGKFGDYTGQIIADGANVFLSTLWNNLLIRGLSALNPLLAEQNIVNVGFDAEIERRIAEQELCSSDPANCPASALASKFDPNNPSCSEEDMDLMLSFNRIGKSLGNIFSTGQGSDEASLSAECQAACDSLCDSDPSQCNPGACANAVKPGATTEDLAKAADSAPGELGTDQKIPTPVIKDIENVVSVANRQEARAGSTNFKSVFDDPANLIGFDLTSNVAQLDLLKELQSCPKQGGQANPSLYNCTLTAKMVTALKEELTIKEVLTKRHVAESAAIGVNSKGEVPSLETGFSLASIQKMRKLRIMPLGLEFAARLKIACYQEKNSPSSIYPYKDISGECVFYDKNNQEIDDLAIFEKLRDEVIAADLKTIIAGFNDQGSTSCGVYTEGEGDDQPSPFCGLVNPDWVVKLPTPSCEEYAPGPILENQKTSKRYTQCNDVVSEVSSGNYGYCVKERNVWDITGQKCDAQYSTCTAYVLKDGTIAPFNKDSLLGAGVCSAENAGCVWFSTVRQGLSWIDTGTKTDRESCLAVGAVWDGIKCVSSRVYINDNIEACPSSDKGCTELKLVKQDGNNIIVDGGFEYSENDDIHPFWKVSKTTKITDDTSRNSCIAAGGFVSSVCTDIKYTDFASCTAQGGSFNYDTNTCSNAILTGVTQNKCGVCKFSGSDSTKDSSKLLLDSASCDANVATGHTWNPGVYTELCSLPDVQCLSGNGSCLMDFSNFSNDEDSCLAKGGRFFEELCRVSGVIDTTITTSQACTAASGIWSDADICLSNEQNFPVSKILTEFNNNSVECRAAGAEFTSSCPFSVSNQNAYDGQKSLNINLGLNYSANEELVVSYPITSDDQSSLVVAGDTYTVQFVAKSNINNLNGRAELVKTYNSGRIDKKTIAITLNTNFQEFSTSLTSITSGTDLELRLIFPRTPNAGVVIDNVKLEYNSPAKILTGGSYVGEYSEYSDNLGLYVKTPPDYLQCRGYSLRNPSPIINTYNQEVTCVNAGLYWDKDSAYGAAPKCYRYEPDHQRCSEYAQVCRNEEAGCQLYTPTNGEPAVPGVLGQNDYCPAECNGYETFKQQASYFEPAGVAPIEYFIPQTATQCSVKDVGCDAFTNTSISASTGDPIEYYTYLRQCIIPNTAQGESGFFIWQGSTSGTPQLKTFNLQADSGSCSNSSFNNDPESCINSGSTYIYDNTGLGGPRVTSVDGYCTQADLGRDLDCLKFYDSIGNEYLRKLSYTIEATSECVTLRKSNSDQISCVRTNGQWVNNECLYKALPSQSQQCQAQVSGCREYVGNTGNNFTPIVFDNFENVTTVQWSNGEVNSDSKPSLSSEAVTTLGKSLEVGQSNSSISREATIITGKSYTLSFWAKTRDGDSRNLGARFSTGDSAQVFVDPQTSVARIGNDWSKVEVGPLFVDWSLTQGNRLILENVGGVYIDNILLTQLKDSVYVVRNSWETPDSCNLTNLGAKLPQAQLGCQEYKTSDEQKLFVKSFAKLCRESSVGCTLVSNTRNSKTPLKQVFNTDNNTKFDDVTVFADKLMALVITKDVLCKSSSRGCSELGIVQEILPTAGRAGITLTLKNDPDKYESGANPIMCKQEALGCVELKNFKGEQDYRKINFSATCSYDESKKGFVKDDGSGLGCAASVYKNESECRGSGGAWNSQYSQCTSGITGLTFANCSLPLFTTDYLRSMRESCISDNDGSWYNNGSQGCGCARNPYQYYKVDEYPEHEVLAVSCPVAQDQCTEYLDFNPNFVYNGDFETTRNSDQTKVDGWNESSVLESGYQTSQQGEVKSGSRAIRLVKNSNKDLPGSTDSLGIPLIETPFYVTQTLNRLEKGKTYEINMDINFNPTLGLGSLGAGDLGVCKPVDFAYELVPAVSDRIKDIFSSSNALESTNRMRILTVETSAGWKRVKSKFIVPQNGLPIPIPATQANPALYCTRDLGGYYSSTPQDVSNYENKNSCETAGFTWKDEVAGAENEDRCVASCFIGNPNEITSNMELRIYTPLNGSCLNKRTGEKRFFLSNGRPFDKYTCEGANATVFPTITVDENYYDGYENRILGSTILDADDSSALGQGDEWEWQGNCRQSSVTIDRLQISPERESLYHFINKGNLDTKSCNGSVNWDAGCIQFENIVSGQNEVIKVKPDRECSEWLFCQSRNEKGACNSWTTCSQQDGDECIRFGSKADELRYQTDNGKLENVTLKNYQRRLGDDELRMSRWRAGDYAGYTIPNLPPLEQIYNIVPVSYRYDVNVPDDAYGAGFHFKGADPLPEFAPNPTLLAEDSLKLSAAVDALPDGTLSIECKNFPEVTSPFVSTLKNIVPGFEGVSVLNGISSVNYRLAGCRYVKYNLKGEEVYYDKQPTTSVFKVCTNESTRGKRCSTNDECGGAGVGVCTPIDTILTTNDYSATLTAISQKAYQGTVGVCVEEDSLIKVTGGLVDDDGRIDDKDLELGQNDKELQNACLTFMPD